MSENLQFEVFSQVFYDFCNALPVKSGIGSSAAECLAAILWMRTMSTAHSNDPLHGVTLAMMLEQLLEHHGWDGLCAQIPVRCFLIDPSIKSSLTFLRKTPWARAKVEALYLQLIGR